jgi:tripartite-type tricarboxylate transporter receptor subunit TctC
VIGRRGALAAPVLLFGTARAQGLFTRPLRLIAPFGPGSTVDLMARALAGPLGEALGQPVVVENRAGAGGNIGVEAAARAAKDGHTLALGTSGPLAINPALLDRMPYDVATELAPVSLLAIGPNLLAVGPAVVAADLGALVAQARARPGVLTYGSSGIGSSNHLAGAVFSEAAGVELNHVPYRGNAEMANDLLAGRLDMVFSGLPPVLPLLQAGNLRALAIAGPRRVPQLPAVPTMAEAGLAEAEAMVFYGLVTAAGTPAPVLAALAAGVRQALGRADLQAVYAGLGSAAEGSTPEAFGTLIASEPARWRGVIGRFGIRPG